MPLVPPALGNDRSGYGYISFLWKLRQGPEISWARTGIGMGRSGGVGILILFCLACRGLMLIRAFLFPWVVPLYAWYYILLFLVLTSLWTGYFCCFLFKRVQKCYIEPDLYGCESWNVDEHIRMNWEATEMWFLGRISSISRVNCLQQLMHIRLHNYTNTTNIVLWSHKEQRGIRKHGYGWLRQLQTERSDVGKANTGKNEYHQYNSFIPPGTENCGRLRCLAR